MAVSYKKLFHMMIEKDMTNAELQQKAGFSANIITRLKRGGYISLESVEKICCVMHCGVDDILDFVPEESKNKGEWKCSPDTPRVSCKIQNIRCFDGKSFMEIECDVIY